MTHYSVPLGTDAEEVLRKLYVDGAGVFSSGLTVSFVFRDSTGTVLQSGDLVEVNSSLAPGWYKLPNSQVLDWAGIYTIEYSPPAGFQAGGDTIHVTSPTGFAQTKFVKGG